MADYESAITYLRKLHPTVRHRVVSTIINDYEIPDDDVALHFCSVCYLTTSSCRGNSHIDFVYCNKRGCYDSMICEKCFYRLYPEEKDSTYTFGLSYLCETHKNTTLFQMLYDRLQ